MNEQLEFKDLSEPKENQGYKRRYPKGKEQITESFELLEICKLVNLPEVTVESILKGGAEIPHNENVFFFSE